MQPTTITHEDKILEAIDQMRRRKARPDADRICNYLLRKYSVDARDTISDLHRLIEAEKVIQVDYKGNISYRNASKWSRLNTYKSKPEVFVRERLNSSMVSGAVGELVLEEPDYLDQGVPPSRLTEQILEGLNNPTSRRIVEDFLSKEVASGNLNRLANGNYSLVSTADMVASPESTQGVTISTTTSVSAKRKVISPYTFVEDEFHSSNSKSSNSSSPKGGDTKNMPKQEDVFEVKAKEEHGAAKQPEQSKGADCQPPSGKKRKQRLMVRKDDPVELFENFGKENLKEEMDKKEERERFSDERDDDGRNSSNPSPTLSNNNVSGFRSARRKRAKKVFDPSDNNVVKRKRGKYATQNKTATLLHDSQEATKIAGKDGPNRQCSLCSKDKSETLIACRDCTVRAHPSCIYTPDEMLIKMNSSWQCERCKSCVICCETSDAGPLITCSSCDEAYHHMCHSPRILAPKSHGKWHCGDCSAKQQNFGKQNGSHHSSSVSTVTANNTTSNASHNTSNSSHPATLNYSNSTNSNSSGSNRSEPRSVSPLNGLPLNLPPVLSPQVSPPRSDSEEKIREATPPKEHAIDPNVPDASDWSTEQVYQYFARLFPKEADTFRHHDIDGPSLLMLKRSDVLTGLDLLLGPALKIYRHVVKLQARRDDPELYWL